MRLSLVPATELNATQRPLYAISQAGQLIGPWRAALELCGLSGSSLALAGSVVGADSAEAAPAMTRSAAILRATPVPRVFSPSALTEEHGTKQGHKTWLMN
jgi:hypothetical protein